MKRNLLKISIFLCIYIISNCVFAQKYSGIQIVKERNFEIALKIKSDSTFVLTRILYPYELVQTKQARKEKRKNVSKIKTTVPKSELDTIAYYNGKTKKINDTTTLISLNSTYALYFFYDDYDEAKYEIGVYPFKKDSVFIGYDSIRFNIKTKFKLIYEDKSDSIYQMNSFYPYKKFETPTLTNFYNDSSWVTARFYFPINPNKFSNSKNLGIDIYLKHPLNNQNIIFNFPSNKYPVFTNWRELSHDVFLITAKKQTYLIWCEYYETFGFSSKIGCGNEIIELSKY